MNIFIIAPLLPKSLNLENKISILRLLSIILALLYNDSVYRLNIYFVSETIIKLLYLLCATDLFV